jgi:hypothetical protein
MKCFAFLEMRKVYWTWLCKVWHTRVRKKSLLICHNFPPTLKRKALAWIWKHERFVAIHSNEKLST